MQESISWLSIIGFLTITYIVYKAVMWIAPFLEKKQRIDRIHNIRLNKVLLTSPKPSENNLNDSKISNNLSNSNSIKTLTTLNTLNQAGFTINHSINNRSKNENDKYPEYSD